ncbi:MAG: hypothetical protein EOO80_15885 [Oxalobacteraceae bacterium]|nr:MAG: hypothetical protein EOO80_15885 [Oxalobacteraceae bacterium]
MRAACWACGRIRSKNWRRRWPRSTRSAVRAMRCASSTRGQVRAHRHCKRQRRPQRRQKLNRGADARQKVPVTAAPKYKDPNSDKTWSGLGRRPGWFVGAPEQYAIQPSGRSPANAAPAPTPAGQQGGEAASA